MADPRAAMYVLCLATCQDFVGQVRGLTAVRRVCNMPKMLKIRCLALFQDITYTGVLLAVTQILLAPGFNVEPCAIMQSTTKSRFAP